jgi:hypothetical protein
VDGIGEKFKEVDGRQVRTARERRERRERERERETERRERA